MCNTVNTENAFTLMPIRDVTRFGKIACKLLINIALVGRDVPNVAVMIITTSDCISEKCSYLKDCLTENME